MRRASLPSRWLFTDERLGGRHPDDPLWRAVDRLPRGGGIIFRHYGWPPGERRSLLDALRVRARRRGLLLLGSGIDGAPDGQHRSGRARRTRRRPAGRIPAGRILVSAAAHSRRELLEAFRNGADLVFLSPVFATASHPGKAGMGPLRFAFAARLAPGPVLALGGMSPDRAKRLRGLGCRGFAGIDCWAGGPDPGADQPGISSARC